MSPYHTQKDLHSQDIFPFWKFPGETLAVLLERFRTEKTISEDIKITYAGRLDPMAEGIVLMLVGEVRFQKDTLLSLEKTYEVQVALGASTDSADMLGIVTSIESKVFDETVITAAIKTIKNTTELPYPMYSSRPVEGKPLFMHARAGTTVTVPIKKISIKKVELLEIVRKPLVECLFETLPTIQKVLGDFRQNEIIQKWNEINSSNSDLCLTLVSIKVTASSGTYMRSLAEKVGELLAVPALAYTIKRIKVGEYE